MLNIISNAADVVILILFFGVTIFVHELGHFLAALKCGMIVDTFSIGFGPAIWKKKIKGVTYKIAWFPLGGYVALPQLDPAGMSKIQGADGQPARELPDISPWKRLIVVLSGVVGNIILGFIIALIIWLHPNAETSAGEKARIRVAEESAAYEAGLRSGSEITAIGGRRVDNWYGVQFELALQAGHGDEVAIDARVDGEPVSVVVSAVIETNRVPPQTYLPGITKYVPELEIGGVERGGEAAYAGLIPRDEAVAVDGVAVSNWPHFMQLLRAAAGGSVDLTVRRRGQERTVSLQIPDPATKEGQWYALGIGKGEGETDVAVVLPGSAAEAAGLLAGDVITAIDGDRVTSWLELVHAVNLSGGRSVDVVIRRGAELHTVQVQAKLKADQLIGISRGTVTIPWMLHSNPFRQISADAGSIFRILGAFVRPKEAGRAAKGLGGPVIIFVLLWQAIQISFINGLGFLRLLNINLAVLNLLPIPVLDGGHAVMTLWEGITRRKPNAKFVNALVNVFAVLLLTAFVALTFRDITLVNRMGCGDPDVRKTPPAATNSVETSTEPRATFTNALETP